ncbi:cyclic AMP-responsive element-binding protein 3-like protein 2 [Scyliorhinus canicula]|uniref:cyclic AMP-responsive element-binding protein 3-like protein 2 n=1 Tax=Scyliorhinus canicula TaxID=7830 RepID=UPI0018F484BB|nr:cyclic AMP-responsive element-binding protein 3-like protein 2 [Scyliorhinus canicula]
MEALDTDITDPLQWDTKLSELNLSTAQCEILYTTHFTEILDELSKDMLGHLFNDPFLSDKCELMDADLLPAPHIQAEHSYSLAGDSRPQSPLTQISTEDDFNEDMECESWSVGSDLKPITLKHESLLCDINCLAPSVTLTGTTSMIVDIALDKMETTPAIEPALDTVPIDQAKPCSQKVLPKIKLEPHEVDQFLNLSPKEAGADILQLPPTPPSSHGSDCEGGQSPTRSVQSPDSMQAQPAEKSITRTPSALSSSPLLTAPHKLQGSSGPLLLTEEEKRTLIAEGYPVPIKLPLTKAEEKALKKIRRKIKNKISAQESRRKKKEYMDTLEKKVESCSNENSELRKKVENLEKANRSLLQQLQGLQVLVAGKVPRPCKMASTQTSTCLMIVVLCFAIALGSFSNRFDPFSSSVTKTVLPVQDSTQESYAATVRSRHLLFYEEHPGFEDEFSSVMSTDAWEKLTESVRERARLAPFLTARGSAQKQQAQEAVTHMEEPAEEYIIANETSTENSVLIELQSQRSLPTVGINGTTIDIDRRVNTTS